MSRTVGRRALLTGAAATAGLVVGGGAVELGNSLSSSGLGTGPHIASPGEELMTEHGVLKRVLLAYRAMIDVLAGQAKLDADTLTEAAQIVADYVESFHEGLEEGYVFPSVAAQGGDLASLVRTLLVQHDRGRHLTTAIQRAATADLSDPKVKTALHSYLTSFVGMYEPHEAREDTVVYPALRRITKQRTLDLLAERFAELENKQYGDNGLAQVLGRVEAIEQRLGIYDLDDVTPPLP